MSQKKQPFLAVGDIRPVQKLWAVMYCKAEIYTSQMSGLETNEPLD